MSDNYDDLLRLLRILSESVISESTALTENNIHYLNQILDQKEDIIHALESGDWSQLLPEQKKFAHTLLSQILTGQHENKSLINEISNNVKSELHDLQKAQSQIREVSKTYGGQYAQSTLSFKA